MRHFIKYIRVSIVSASFIAFIVLSGCGAKAQPKACSAPVSDVLNHAPHQPTLHSPLHKKTVVSLEQELKVKVSDPDSNQLDVAFYGREVSSGASKNFTVILLPDTQFYSQDYPAQFIAQTQWIIGNRRGLNIVYVVHVGDIVQLANQEYQWKNADAAMSVLEDPLTTALRDGMPYGIAPGNHDQWPLGDPDGDSTRLYNHYFGVDRFVGRSYYGDHYGGNNDNHYDFFSAGGMDFIMLYLEYDTTPDESVLRWADNVLKTYSNHHAILVSHYLMDVGEQSSFGPQGTAIYNFLKGNPNVFLMLCGHMHGEGKRTDVDMPSGSMIQTILADYQDRANGGDGWLRILEFSPAYNEIHVKTYSPTLDTFETDADSQFTFNPDMERGSPFAELELVQNVFSGGEAEIAWKNLSPDSAYQWYVTISDGDSVTKSPVWTFTTQNVK